MTEQDKSKEWPEGVNPITINGLDRLGIHKKTGRIYWDGAEVIVRRPVQLGWFERILAGTASISALGMLVIEIGRSATWWGG